MAQNVLARAFEPRCRNFPDFYLCRIMDSRRLDWKLARVTGSNMMEIRDVTVSSERHFNFCSTAQ